MLLQLIFLLHPLPPTFPTHPLFRPYFSSFSFSTSFPPIPPPSSPLPLIILPHRYCLIALQLHIPASVPSLLFQESERKQLIVPLVCTSVSWLIRLFPCHTGGSEAEWISGLISRTAGSSLMLDRRRWTSNGRDANAAFSHFSTARNWF